MFFTVPLLVKIRVPQTEVCREVNDLCAELGIRIDILLRLSMRLGEEENINRLQLRRVIELQLRALPQIRMGLIHILPHP